MQYQKGSYQGAFFICVRINNSIGFFVSKRSISDALALQVAPNGILYPVERYQPNYYSNRKLVLMLGRVGFDRS